MVTNNQKHKVHRLLQSKSPSEITRLLTIDVETLAVHSGDLRLAAAARSRHQSWNLYQCPRCSLAFHQRPPLSRHIVDNHINPNKDLSFLVPKRADRSRIDDLLNQNWDPIEIDAERADLLLRIRSGIQKLADFDVMAGSLIDILFKIAGDETQSSKLSFRLLNASKLRVIVSLLYELISECCKNEESYVIEEVEANEAEKLLVNDDNSKLILNPKQFLGKSCDLDIDALVSWLYDESSSSSVENCLSRWNKLKNVEKHQSGEIFNKIKEEFEQLERICIKKHNCLRYQIAATTLEKVFLELVHRTNQSQEAVIRKLRGDLSEREGTDKDVLRLVAFNVHKEAESLKSSKMRNLVKLAKQVDNSIVEAFRKQIWDSNYEETRYDAKLLRKSIDIRQLQAKLENISKFDYRVAVQPLMKSFLQRRLEDEAEAHASTPKNTNDGEV